MFALVFAPATVSPPVLRRTRTAYCAADVVKRQWSKKNLRTFLCCRLPAVLLLAGSRLTGIVGLLCGLGTLALLRFSFLLFDPSF